MKKAVLYLTILTLPLLGAKCVQPPEPPQPPEPEPKPITLDEEGWQITGNTLQVTSGLVYLEVKTEGEDLIEPPMMPNKSRVVYKDNQGNIWFSEEFDEFAMGEDNLKKVKIDQDLKETIHLATYSGGAHCCFTNYIYRVHEKKLEKLFVYNSGSGMLTFGDITEDGIDEVFTGDQGYDYRFTAHAFSAIPIFVFKFQDNTLVNISKDYPVGIEEQIKNHKEGIVDLSQEYDQDCTEQDAPVRGPLAAIVGLYFHLGKGTEAKTYFDSVCKDASLYTEMADFARESVQEMQVVESAQ